MVALLRIRAASAAPPRPRRLGRAASAAPPQGDLPPGSMQSGRDIHIGHKVNAVGVLAVSGILAAPYLALGATGVVRPHTRA